MHCLLLCMCWVCFRYATGHETSPFLPLAQFWAVGDTTSGTRAYSTLVFKRLLDAMWLAGASRASTRKSKIEVVDVPVRLVGELVQT